MITVRTCKSQEVTDYREKKYNEFLNLYLTTNIPVRDIFKKIGVNNTNQTAQHIRKSLRRDGHDASSRWQKIKKNKWVEHWSTLYCFTADVDTHSNSKFGKKYGCWFVGIMFLLVQDVKRRWGLYWCIML